MSECIFCKIAKGEIPSVKIWEDDGHIAFLDMFPNRDGMTLVIPKKHFDSNIFDLPRVEYKNFMLATKKVAKYLERGLRADRVLMVMEGLEIGHAHIKLYPFFEKMPEGLGIPGGEKKSEQELLKIANKIKENNK